MKMSLAGAALLVAGATHAYAPPQDTGEHTYTTLCQGCHMPNGAGAVGAGFYPKLAGDPALASWEYVAITVLNGRHAMPPFGTRTGPPSGFSRWELVLTDAEIADVVNYVRAHLGNAFTDQASAQGVSALPHPRSGAS